MKIKIAGIIVGAALMVGGLFGTLANSLGSESVPALNKPTAPYCPEEDSCSVHYDGVTNSWVVTEDRP